MPRDYAPSKPCEVCQKMNHYTHEHRYNNTPGHNVPRNNYAISQHPSRSVKCQLCYKSGHTANNCRGADLSNQMASCAQLHCDKCKSIGNTAATCRVRDVHCSYCRRMCHTINECYRKRNNEMPGNGSGPSRTSTPREARITTKMCSPENDSNDLVLTFSSLTFRIPLAQSHF